MSAGLQLITALITQGGSLRGIRAEYFNDQERSAWEFLARYHTVHGALPTAEVFAEAGIMLAPASGTLSYHLERLRNRAVYDAIQSHHLPLVQALGRRDVDGAVEALNVMQEGVGDARTMDRATSMEV